MSEPENWQRVYRATLDTNIFVRVLLQEGNLANHLLSLWREGRFVLVLSQAIVAEVQEVLSRPSLKQKFRSQAATQLINLLTQRAKIIEVPFSYKLCRDVEDNRFVDCAIFGRVQFLVSYDNDLIADPKLIQALFEHGVEPVDPLAFLERIQGGRNQQN